MRALLLVLVVAVAQTEVRSAPQDDCWHFLRGIHSRNPFFWDFKYFNFHDENISGNISYFTVAPHWSRRFFIKASFFNSEKVWNFHESFSMESVAASRHSPILDVDKRGGIHLQAEERLRIFHHSPALNWEFLFESESLPFDRTLSLDLNSLTKGGWDRKLFPWQMNWRPSFPSARAKGSFQFSNGRKFTVNTPRAYHDENWGVWFPPKQPFRWMHFSGVDSSGERIVLLLGEFPKNPEGFRGGMSLLDLQGEFAFFPNASYEWKVLQKGHTRISRRGFKVGYEFTQGERATTLSAGDHSIPIQFELSSPETFSLLAASYFAEASGPKIPHLVRSLISDFSIDEQVIFLRLRYKSRTGELRTAEGFGEFMFTQ